eukprot:g10895.t1
MARTLAPRVGARLIAAATLAQLHQEGQEASGYLKSVLCSLDAGGPLPQVPLHWPLVEVETCLNAALRAINGQGDVPQVRVEVACSWDARMKAFGPSKADLTIRLGYLQARQALHAFVGGARPNREEAGLLQQRLEALSGDMQPQDLLNVQLDFTDRPLRLATGCSGAEAPHFALQQLMGHRGFEQMWGSEINENPRRFILKNCSCQHLFEDVCFVMKGGGRCARHGGHCTVPSGEIDIFIGGFPCTPYSFCNPKRFKRNCFTEPAAAPFFEMRKFIAERRPRLVILENVRGLLAPNPETDSSPIDFILRGRNPENPEDCYQGTAPNADWGLSLIEGYGLRWDILYSCDWGLPQSRPRVYIVMVRDDAGGQAAAEHVFEVLSACAGRMPRGSCNDFLFPDEHPQLVAATKHWASKPGPGSGRRACTKFTEALFRTKRQELGLDPKDRPYSGNRPAGWYPHATEKMVQQLDIIYSIRSPTLSLLWLLCGGIVVLWTLLVSLLGQHSYVERHVPNPGMDFDDLDDEIEKRVQDGEEVACHVVENQQPVKGTVLPLMTRSTKLPDFSRLPAAKKKALPPYNGEAVPERSPKLRLLCIHGAADSYAAEWCVLENEAPPNIEVAVHEFPGHGHRDDEDFCTTLDQLVDDCFDAFRDAMNTGAFAFLGHSIGALMAIKVAKRAKAELGVEPVFVVMLERGAAEFPLFTEKGAHRPSQEPVSFFEVWNPTVYKLYKSAGEADQEMVKKKMEIGAYMKQREDKVFQGHFPDAALSGVIVSSGVAPGGTDGKSGGDPEQYGPGRVVICLSDGVRCRLVRVRTEDRSVDGTWWPNLTSSSAYCGMSFVAKYADGMSWGSDSISCIRPKDELSTLFYASSNQMQVAFSLAEGLNPQFNTSEVYLYEAIEQSTIVFEVSFSTSRETVSHLPGCWVAGLPNRYAQLVPGADYGEGYLMLSVEDVLNPWRLPEARELECTVHFDVLRDQFNVVQWFHEGRRPIALQHGMRLAVVGTGSVGYVSLQQLATQVLLGFTAFGLAQTCLDYGWFYLHRQSSFIADRAFLRVNLDDRGTAAPAGAGGGVSAAVSASKKGD